MQLMLKVSLKILILKLFDDQQLEVHKRILKRVVVRFLQPPPVPPPGVSVSKRNDLQ